jgi:hypothetical protein
MSPSSYPTSGTRLQQENKSAGCLSSIFSFFTPTPEPVPIATIAWNRTGVDDLRPVSRQPGPEIAMVMLQPPSAARVRSGEHQLNHHTDGSTDDSSSSDGESIQLQVPRPTRQRNPNATRRIDHTLETTAEVRTEEARTFLAKLSPRQSFSSPAQPGPGLAIEGNAGHFFFSLDEDSFGNSIARLETYLKLTAPPSDDPSPTDEDIRDWAATMLRHHPQYEAETDDVEDTYTPDVEPVDTYTPEGDPVYTWESESDTSFWADGFGPVTGKVSTALSAGEGMAVSDEASDSDDDQHDIPMARPAVSRMDLSDDESDDEDHQGIPMARPTAQRMKLSDDELDSDDEILTVQPAAHRCRMSDCFSAASSDDDEDPFIYDLPATGTFSPDRVDSITSPIQESFAYHVIFANAPSNKSHAAQICSGSDSEDEDEDIEILHPGVYVDPVRRSSPVVDLMQVAFLEDLHRYPFFDEAAEQIEEVADKPNYPDYIFDDCRDLISMGSGQYCLGRFLRGWENPWARPINQSLFADFDGDYTNQDHAGDRCNSCAAGDDQDYANVFIPTRALIGSSM